MDALDGGTDLASRLSVIVKIKRWIVAGWLAVGLSGCAQHGNGVSFGNPDFDHYVLTATQIDYPDSYAAASDSYAELASMPAPRTLDSADPVSYWDLGLPEAIQMTLQNSKVLRDLGGFVLRAPTSVSTVHTPAIQETDPRFGVERALSAFDASISTQLFVEKNDRALNNSFFGGGTRLLRQDLFGVSSELAKRSVAGTRMSARHRIDYDYNNAPGNNIPNLPWLTTVELEVRQPLLQGSGVDFNRIAGPGATPGVYNGVLVARINTDISVADFEIGVRDLVNDVETAYWELYYAYRNFDGIVAARDRALRTWQRIQGRAASGLRGSDSATEARAREQYFRLDADVQNALSGRIQERSRTTTFRGVGGVLHNERQLRLLLGVPINDGQVIRPVSEPSLARVRFDWSTSLSESLDRRVELRKQQWRVKRRELELVAARNHLYPQLDVFSRYRWRGLGHDLIEPNGNGRLPFNDAFQNLTDGNFQEWQVGAEFAMPVGFRQANTAVRNAQLNLVNDRLLLEEQQRDVALELSNAVAELDRAYHLSEISLNRRTAVIEELEATEVIYDDADENQRGRLLDLLLDAQRRLAEADSEFHRALVEYMLAIKQVHYSKGSLLDYNEIVLSEGNWPDEAYAVAAERERRRLSLPRMEPYIMRSPTVSSGE